MTTIQTFKSSRGIVEVFDLPAHIGLALQEPNSARLYRAWPKGSKEADEIVQVVHGQIQQR